MADKKWKILIADDAVENVELISEYLKKEDFDLIKASSGEEVLELVNEVKPDLVLLDVLMPGMSGFEVCRQLKNNLNEDLSFLPVILITALEDVESKKQGLLSGAEDFVTKPFNREELIARIKVQLRTKSLYDRLRQAYARIDKERDVVAELQRSLLPGKRPDIKGMSLYAHYQPSAKAGGDYYDVLKIDENHFALTVADVSGHGTPAAVVMAMVKAIIQACAPRTFSPAETLRHLDQALCKNIVTGNFVTIFYGLIDIGKKIFTYSSAGHNAPIRFVSRTKMTEELRLSKGHPLCLLPRNEFEERSVKLRKGDKLILYTDGLTETFNPEGELFGTERLFRIAKQSSGVKAEQLGKKILDAVEKFRRHKPFHDDFTFLIVDIV